MRPSRFAPSGLAAASFTSPSRDGCHATRSRILRHPDRSSPRRRSWSTHVVIGLATILSGAVSATALIDAPAASGGTVGDRGTSCADFEGPFPGGPLALSGCSDAGNTGRAGSLDNRTGVITWATGMTTTVTYTMTPITKVAKHSCPPTAAAEFKLRGTVIADTTGSIEVGGPVTGKVCARENGVLTNARGTTLKIL